MECRKLDHRIVVAASVSGIAIFLLVSTSLMMNILSTFFDGFVVDCVKLMLSKFLHLWLLQFVALCLKYFTRYGHCEVEDIIIQIAVVSEISVPKIRAFSCGLSHHGNIFAPLPSGSWSYRVTSSAPMADGLSVWLVRRSGIRCVTRLLAGTVSDNL